MSDTHQNAQGQVPLKTKVKWGFGGLADNFMFNTLTALGTLVYVTHFKFSPELAGLALALPRIIDAFTDPWIGNLSDNWKSRFGRRRPFMFVGVLFCALLLPLLWTPVGLETVDNPWYTNIPFFYVCIIGSLLAIVYTLFVVPYTALGFELTNDYDERTRVVRWRMLIGLGGSLGAGWLFKLAADDYFQDVGSGAFWVTVGVSLVVLISGLIPTLGCKEVLKVENQEPIKLLPAIRYTMTNKPFVILFVTYITIIIALFAAQSIAPLILLHYVFEADEGAMGLFLGKYTAVMVAVSYLSMFVIGYLSTRYNKRAAMITGLGFMVAGTIFNYFAIDPRWPWAMFVAIGIASIGMQGCWLMVDSMVADICDDDELKTGRRREGMFSAVKGFALKAAQGLTFGIGGYMAGLAGYSQAKVDTGGLDEATAITMKGMMVGFQTIGLLVAIFLMIYYPISRQRAEETRRLLAEKADI